MGGSGPFAVDRLFGDAFSNHLRHSKLVALHDDQDGSVVAADCRPNEPSPSSHRFSPEAVGRTFPCPAIATEPAVLVGDEPCSGLIVAFIRKMRPATLFILIWLAWAVSWMLAAFWSERTEKRLATWDVWTYRALVLAGAIVLSHWTARALGEQRT